jgi:hypothetical protein
MLKGIRATSKWMNIRNINFRLFAKRKIVFQNRLVAPSLEIARPSSYFMGLLRYFSDAYHYVYYQYGFFGIALCALCLVLAFVGTLIWFDRRR